jgi:peptidoglycan/LPS O-acetylase OafA/YrhL
MTAELGAPPRPDAVAPVVRRRRRGDRPAALPPLEHQPGLDGLRALAVVAVCLYHARFAWAAGGFLGVSLFFTLSGFLITSLLVREHSGAERVDLKRFWSRRFRRLMPAAVATLGLVVAMGWLGAFDDQQLRALRGDVPAALFWVVNWRFVLAGTSYGAAQASPSPLEHFWSLSVEEQFYFVFPLVLVACLAWAGRSRRLLVAVLAVVAAVSALLCGILAAGSVDRAYFGTDARMLELVAGALLACALARGTRIRRLELRAAVLGLGVAALVVTIWLWHVATVPARWLYPWGLAGGAVCSAALICASMQPGPLRAVLSLRPLRFIGRISYGVYLLHWPVFRWLTPTRTHLGPWPLFVVQMIVTVGAATAMHRWIEEPIRRGHALGGNLPKVVAPLAFGVVLVGALTVTSGLPPVGDDLDAAIAQGAAATGPARTRVLVVGDQLAASVGAGLQAEAPRRADVRVESSPWCGLAVGGYVRLADGSIERDTDRCGTVRDAWAAAEGDFRPDVVVIVGTMRDAADRKFALDDPWTKPGDPTWDDFYRTELKALRGALGGSGAPVLWVAAPTVRNTRSAPPLDLPPATNEQTKVLDYLHHVQAEKGVPPPGFSENDDQRVAVVDQAIAQVAPTRPGDRFADLAGWMAARPDGGLSTADRPDGVALSRRAGRAAARWLQRQAKGMHRSRTRAVAAPKEAAAADFPAEPPAGPRRVVPAGRAPKILVVGDSVAHGVGYGLSTWSTGPGHGAAVVANGAQLGCPIARNGLFKFLGQIDRFMAKCDWAGFFPRFLADENPDLVVLQTGIWEVVDRILPGDDTWRHLGEPLVDHYFETELLSAIDTLDATGARVVLLTYPHFDAGANQGFSNLPESQPARVDRLNDLVRDAASRRPDVTTVVDLQSWLAGQPGGELDPAKRKDGLHFQDDYVPTIAAWLGPKLVDIARNGPPASS